MARDLNKELFQLGKYLKDPDAKNGSCSGFTFNRVAAFLLGDEAHFKALIDSIPKNQKDKKKFAQEIKAASAKAEKILPLTAREAWLVEVEALYVNIGNAQYPERHRKLTHKVLPQHDFSELSFIVGSKKLIEEGKGLTVIYTEPHILTVKGIEAYLESLKKILDQYSKYNVAIAINNYNHVIDLTYDIKAQTWSLGDINAWETAPISIAAIAEKIKKEIFNREQKFPSITFNTTILGLASQTPNNTRLARKLDAFRTSHLNLITEETTRILSDNTLAYMAADFGHADFVAKWLEKGGDPNIQNKQGQFSPLCAAAYNGYEEIVKRLLEGGANPNLLVGDSSALHYAIINGHLEAVIALLERGANPNLRHTTAKVTPLYRAIVTGQNLLMIEALLKYGANPNLQVTTNEATPLFVAAELGNIESMHLLINYGANIHLGCGIDGCTPLRGARENRQAKAIEVLLEYGAKYIDDSLMGEGILAINSVLLDDGEAAEALLCKGVNPDVISLEDGATLLLVAAEQGRLSMVSSLLRHGAQPDTRRESDGLTPAMIALDNGHIAVVNNLLSMGANPNLTHEPDSPTLLFQAAAKGHVELVKNLLSKGAETNLSCTYALKPNEVSILLRLFAQRQGRLQELEEILAKDPRLEEILARDQRLEEILAHDPLPLPLPVLSCSYRGATPLFIAALHGDAAVSDALMQTTTTDKTLPGSLAMDQLRRFCQSHSMELYSWLCQFSRGKSYADYQKLVSFTPQEIIQLNTERQSQLPVPISVVFQSPARLHTPTPPFSSAWAPQQFFARIAYGNDPSSTVHRKHKLNPSSSDASAPKRLKLKALVEPSIAVQEPSAAETSGLQP